MATFLDISGLSFFSSIFTFLLIFVAVYALLSWGKVLGSNNGIHSIMAAAVAVLFMFSKDAIEFVNFVVPWFVIMFIVILLMLMAYSMFNPGSNVFDILVGSGRHTTVVYWIITISVIIILLGLGNTYGQKAGPYLDKNGEAITVSDYGNDTNVISGVAENFRGEGLVSTGDWRTNIGATLFHPRILGIIFILLLATFTILFLAKAGG